MKKVTVAALALLVGFSGSALSQTEKVVNIGGVAVSTTVVVGVAASVAAAIVSNARASGTLPVAGPGPNPGPNPPVLTLVCNQGDAAPVDGVCTNNSTTVTVTGTGTMTSTITVPVVTTYPAILTQVP